MATTIQGSGGVTTNSGAVYDGLQRATAQNSTSGTSIDFTGIPSWVKRITVMFNGVSTSGTSNVQVQVGSGSFATSGYLGASGDYATAAASGTSTTGIRIGAGHDASVVLQGHIVCTNISSNIWVASGVIVRSNSGAVGQTASSISLGGTLDRIRITTINGTDTFDAGSINILYE